MLIQRRSFITGLISLIAAPAIVRAGSLMPVKAIDLHLIDEELISLFPGGMQYAGIITGLPAANWRLINQGITQ